MENPGIALTLHVELPATYPKTTPILKVKNLDCANQKAPEKIQAILKSAPEALLGSEMIYEICGQVQDVLNDAANQKAANEGMGNLEQERMAQEAAADREAAKHEQELLRREESLIAEKDRLLAQKVQHEHDRREARAWADQQSLVRDHELAARYHAEGVVTFDQAMTTKDTRDNSNFTFRAVSVSSIVLRTSTKKVAIVIPIAGDDIQVPQLLLKDIVLTENASETVNLRQEILEIENLLESSKNHRHRNVVDLLGYKVERSILSTSDRPAVTAKWELSILSDYANKGSLADLLDMVDNLGAGKVRSWTHQLLDALQFFDENGYVHPALHLENVLLFRDTTGAITIKLSDGYGTALRHLVLQSRAQAGSTPAEAPYWTAPELALKTPNRSNKTCLWDLGVTILQMVFGKAVTKTFTSPSACIRATNLTRPLRSMLEMMFQTDARKRPKAFELTSLAFFESDNGPLLEDESTEMSSTPFRRSRGTSSFMLPSRPSRYETEWVEVGRLGKGGFGEVVKARNRIDGQIYAIKKIVGESPDDLVKDLNEAKLLSRLKHPFVVRYYGAWDEKEAGSEFDSIGISEPPSPDRGLHCDPLAMPSTGHDFMSTSNYRNIGIQFGLDSDDDQEQEEGVDGQEAVSEDFPGDSDNHLPVLTTESLLRDKDRERREYERQTKPQKWTLYIQMEFCENLTLRDLIKHNLPGNIDEGWRLFRQILDALAHIHGLGIVHRDLKPDNIFIDHQNHPRIGDFGLATIGFSGPVARGSVALVAGPDTRSIGTMYYVAPELRSVGSGKYSTKVDMYSLGIIFFEMCYPLQTSMERDRQLRMIRKEIPVMPETFDHSDLAVQGNIIRRLLSHRERERPSAHELLTGGTVPEPLEEEKVRRYLHGIAASESGEYQKVLSSFFLQPVDKVKDVAWDNRRRVSVGTLDALTSMFVKEKMVSVFRRHGAVEINRKGVFPKSDLYTNEAKYLDSSGMAVQLPYDLTLPLARMIAQIKPEAEKVYSFGSVYRSSVIGQEPATIVEVDFDIVSDKAIDLALKEAEVMKTLDEIFAEFPVFGAKPMCFVLNHSDLLKLVLDYCRIKPEQQDLVTQVLSNLNLNTPDQGRWGWTRIRNELRTKAINIASTSLDDLMRFDFRETFEGGRDKLEVIFETTESLDKLAHIMSRLQSVMTYLRRFHVNAKVYLSPLSNNSEPLYRGSLLFQLVDDSQKRIIAAGGRYDELIQKYQTTSAKPIRAAGFRLRLMDIVEAVRSDGLKPSRNRSSKTTAPGNPVALASRRCDVLVTSFDTQILRTSGVDLLQELWASGISAELSGDFNSMEELGMAYKKENIGWVVNIRHDNNAVGGRTTRVRSLGKGPENEVRMPELSDWLSNEIREREHREGGQVQTSVRLRREASQGESAALTGDVRASKVKVVLTEHRGKKTNRQDIIASAVLRTRELTDSFLADAPIAAVELTNDNTLEHIRNTRLADGESWKLVLQSVPSQERRYVQLVFELLKDYATEGHRGAFVFNFRTKACIYYDL